MITYIDGSYIGHAPPFQHGKTYPSLRVKQDMFGYGITVQATHGWHREPVEGISIHYPNLNEFFKDWVTGAVYEYMETPQRRKTRKDDD